MYNTELEFDKKCGVRGKRCNVKALIPNSIFRAGDIANLNLHIDNSRVRHACSVVVEQVLVGQLMHGPRLQRIIQRTMFGKVAGPKEPAKNVTLQLRIAGDFDRSYRCLVNDKDWLPSHKMFHMLYDKLPESTVTPSFYIAHKLRVTLDHEDIVLTKGTKAQDFYFQLVCQPSLV